MRTKEGKVMSIREMEAAGIPLPEYEEETEERQDRQVKVVKQVPASGAGIYKPETGEVIDYPKPKKEDNEELKKAA
jgi:predicted nucleotidyltransferase